MSEDSDDDVPKKKKKKKIKEKVSKDELEKSKKALEEENFQIDG